MPTYQLIRTQRMRVTAPSAQDAAAIARAFPAWRSDDVRIDMTSVPSGLPFGEVTPEECDAEVDAWHDHQAQEVHRHAFGGAA